MKRYYIYLMPLLYILAGINHFLHPQTYMKIMPPWLPAHRLLVDGSGVAEIICGCLLIFKRTRVTGGWLTIALLIAVFPANIQMAFDFYREEHKYLWIALLRLPMQLLLIYWAGLYTKPPLSQA